MKKRMLTMLFAMMMLAGCGGAAEQEQENTQAQEQSQEQGEAVLIEDDAVYRFLKDLPAEIPVEDAVANGFFTIQNGEAKNQEVWDTFVAACEKGEEAAVVVCQYTQKDGVVLDHLTHHADGRFEVVTDTTRDGYDDEKSVMKMAETYTAMNVFENFALQEGGKEYTVCVLSDNSELTADEFRTCWIEMKTEENNVYMLYVI